MSKIMNINRAFSTNSKCSRTALYNLHLEYGAKMVPFAGWEMPVQYDKHGISQSSIHTRTHASLFDVSHMLQTRLFGKDRVKFMESLVVADLQGMKIGMSALSVFTNENGGIIDDTIVNIQSDHLYVVSNAACAEKDLSHLQHYLDLFKGDVTLEKIDETSLLALQGPSAASLLEHLCGDSLADFAFMTTRKMKVKGIECHVSRSGYTGEDGFEIQVSNDKAVDLASLFLTDKNVKWAGLGARDSLRLEAGMCLYGHDLDDTTSPVEGGLSWVIPKRRREEGGFLGDNVILDHLKNGVARKRVGFVVEGAPAREGSEIFSTSGELIGKITSGGPSPNLSKNIAMGYVKTGFHKTGTELLVRVRQRDQKAVVSKMPFVESRYHKI